MDGQSQPTTPFYKNIIFWIAIITLCGTIFNSVLNWDSGENAAKQSEITATETAEARHTHIAATKPTPTITAEATVPTSSPSPTVEPTEVFTPSRTPTQTPTPTPTPTLTPTPTGPEISMAFPQERMNVPRQLTACGTFKNVPEDKEMWFYVHAPGKDVYYLDKILDKSATDGTWIIRDNEGVNVGSDNDAGSLFEVGVVLASPEESRLWEEGEEKNTIKKLPPSLSKFSERSVRVETVDEPAPNLEQNCLDQLKTGSALGE